MQTMKTLKNTLIQPDIEKKHQTSTASEYKSSWNDVNIQGDYDQYARSVFPGRSQNNSVSPQQSHTSTKLKENDLTQDKPAPRKNRVKLNKSNNQVLKAPNLSLDKMKETPGNSTDFTEKTDLNINEFQKKNELEKKEMKHFTADRKFLGNLPTNKLTENKNIVLKSCQTKRQNELYLNTTSNDLESTDKKSPLPEKSNELKQHAAKWTRNLNKSSLEFIPPVVTAVDFKDPHLSQAVKSATKNGLLVENTNLFDNCSQGGSISRMSTLLMASYLGTEYSPSPNIITSISVNPLLPPLILKRRPGVRRRYRMKRGNVEESPELQIRDKKKSSDVHSPSENNAEKLAPLRDAHLYKWKHDPCSDNLASDNNNNNPKPISYRLPARSSDIETIFDQIVRWRSKVRHCGKPAMFRRVISPTLGEEALKRKLTDRLPSRQIRKLPQKAGLQLTEESEIKGNPADKKTSSSSVKQYIKKRLDFAQNYDSFTSPTAIEELCDVNAKSKQASFQQPGSLSTSRNEIMKLPLPGLSLRKRQPVWQRMR